MKSITKFLLSTLLLCMSQMAFADRDDADALPNCHPVSSNPNIGHSSGSQEGNGSTSGSGQTTTPTDPPKTSRDKCLKTVAVTYVSCRARANGKYKEALSTTCMGLKDASVCGTDRLISGTVSVNDYNRCKDIEGAKKQNAIDVCIVFEKIQISACP